MLATRSACRWRAVQETVVDEHLLEWWGEEGEERGAFSGLVGGYVARNSREFNAQVPLLPDIDILLLVPAEFRTVDESYDEEDASRRAQSCVMSEGFRG